MQSAVAFTFGADDPHGKNVLSLVAAAPLAGQSIVVSSGRLRDLPLYEEGCVQSKRWSESAHYSYDKQS
jgi:hypothetical protein